MCVCFSSQTAHFISWKISMFSWSLYVFPRCSQCNWVLGSRHGNLGSSIKKAQQAVANKALTESTLSPNQFRSHPRAMLIITQVWPWLGSLCSCPLCTCCPLCFSFYACCTVSGFSDSRIVTEDERMKKVIGAVLKFCFNDYSKGVLFTF